MTEILKILNKFRNITIIDYKNGYDNLSYIYFLDECIQKELSKFSYTTEIQKMLKKKDTLKNLLDFNYNISENIIEPFYKNNLLKIMPLSFCKKYNYEVSWSIFNKNVLKQLKKYIGNQSVLSVGSGQAFNELLMKLSGINIIATDNYESYGKNKEYYYTEVLNYNSRDAIQNIKSDILYLSWPQQDYPMASDSLQLFKGNKFIYVGDMCLTGNSLFYNLLNTKWKLIQSINLVKWNSVNDVLNIYEKY